MLFANFRQDDLEDTILVLKNVPFRRTVVIQYLVQGGGHRLLFLHPYSPFMNPIENVFF